MLAQADETIKLIDKGINNIINNYQEVLNYAETFKAFAYTERILSFNYNNLCLYRSHSDI